MQTIITIPSSMPTHLVKLSPTLYHHKQTNTFYKSAILPSLTMFCEDNLINRHNMVFTKYDSHFLVIKILFERRQIGVADIPPYLSQDQFDKFSSKQAGKFHYNQQKVWNFLEERIDAVEKIIRENEYEGNDQIKMKIETDKKLLSSSTLQILKNDIPQLILQSIILAKYECEKKKKHINVDEFTEQVQERKNDKKKKSASKPTIIPKNQTLMTSFFKKKQ